MRIPRFAAALGVAAAVLLGGAGADRKSVG